MHHLDIEKIMEKLETEYTWTSTEEDTPDLTPCMFCGGNARIVVRKPRYGLSGAWVCCIFCGACGPSASIHAWVKKPGVFCTPLLPESLERGITLAVETWNAGAVGDLHLGNLVINTA